MTARDRGELARPNVQTMGKGTGARANGQGTRDKGERKGEQERKNGQGGKLKGQWYSPADRGNECERWKKFAKGGGAMGVGQGKLVGVAGQRWWLWHGARCKC